MVYRGRYESDQYEEHYRNIVLRQQSALGPWFVMGLGAMLAIFVIYLVYSNLLVPPSTLPSSERSLRVITIPSSISPFVPDSVDEDLLPQLGLAITGVPHSRAANALLGGHGPAAVSGLATTAQRGTPDLVTGRGGLAR